MAQIEKQYRVSAADATTATLVPRTGERDPLQRVEPEAPTQIVLTFAATPTRYAVNRIIAVELEAK